ncbi:MAG: Na+/H+ antiporter subunit E [Pseudomonadota bacterium]|jgi:multicomponent K+:H+ antiporter subunit E
MRAALPAPLTSLGILVAWVLLNGASAGHALLGAALAVALPLVVPRLRVPSPSNLHAPGAAIALLGVFLYDMVVANIDVARRVLGPESRIHPGYIRVPLGLRDPRAVSILASIVTMTPGTLSAALESGGRVLLVHCFHLTDPEATVASIKLRYEAPLRRIFEPADAGAGAAP